jgi:peptidoglycan/xylan/chitin deacetylase (PgdA/CDA1 family)
MVLMQGKQQVMYLFEPNTRTGMALVQESQPAPYLSEPSRSQVMTSIQLDDRTPRVSLIIPTRNEAQNLHHVLSSIPSIVNEVILVDGHSADNTIAVAQQLLPSIRVIRQQRKGKGDALRIGFAASTGDIIVMIDADGSTDPNEIPRFVQALLDGSDFAKGSRFMQGAGSDDITLLRGLGNSGLNWLVNILFGTRYSDLCYGYNAFWRSCLNHVRIDCDGFEVETLMNIRAHKAGLKIVEVPSTERPRVFGGSNLNAMRDGWRVLKTIVKERVLTNTSEDCKVPILVYHSISAQATPHFKEFAVHPDLFAEHMAYLHQQGYTPLTVSEFVKALSGRKTACSALPGRPVVVTFDGAFADFYTEALPVLVRYGIVATLYVPTAFVNGTSGWLYREGEVHRPLLNWQQLRQISDAGIECGAYSHFHHRLNAVPLSVACDEVVTSKRILEEHLAVPVTSFAYPFGYYTPSVRRLVQAAGYTSACAVKYRMSSIKSNPFALPRLMVGATTRVEDLHAMLNGQGLAAIKTVYVHARTSVKRKVRRGLASLNRNEGYGGGYLVP